LDLSKIDIGLTAICDHSGGWLSGAGGASFVISATSADPDGWATLQNLIDSLCEGEAISVPFESANGTDFCTYAGDPITIQIVDGSECGNSVTTSYNCIGGVCTKLADNSGTYATLSDCITSPCDKPAATYACVLETCTDTQDGTGPFSSIADCVAAGCAPPTCDGLTGCPDMRMTAEIHGLANCPAGARTDLFSNLNGVYFLDYEAATSYSFFLSIVDVDGGGDPITGVYSDPHVESDTGIPWSVESGGGNHDEYYVYAIRITTSCTDGQVTITDLTLFLQRFQWTDPASPSPTGTSSISLGTVSSTLSATAGTCAVGYMLTIFGFNDCDSNPVTYNVSAHFG
jgi:hypothetical protein